MPETVMDKLVALCKRRGFVYPASEIYGGINGFWDYGPLGVLLKNNIRDHWWRHMVLTPPIGPDGEPVEIVGLDSSIIQNPQTWVASGHVGGFSDPMVDDRETKQRYRADQLCGLYVEGFDNAGAMAVVDDTDYGLAVTGLAASPAEFAEAISAMKKAPIHPAFGRAKRISLNPQSDWLGGEPTLVVEMADGSTRKAVAHSRHLMEQLKTAAASVPSPDTGKVGVLTEPRQFNLMFVTFVGAVQTEDAKAYLRPETAQGIFLNHKNVLDTTRVKVPFGIAQVGKSFRNEVTPRNFIFRSREFEQMEMEWFCHPDDAATWYDFWKNERMKWWLSLGVNPQNLILRDHDPDELSHYSKMTVDIEYRYPFTAPGFGELEGIAHRGSFDLTQHQTHSKQKLEYFDQARELELKAAGVSGDELKAKTRYIPNVIEPASGLTRAVLVLLTEAYTEDPERASGVVMKFHPKFAPIKAGIFPLVNKDGMPETAMALYRELREDYTVEYDPKQSIGKRYARMDEIGTPYCFTVDGQTAEDGTVTVRHRDDMKQERIDIKQVKAFLRERI